MKDIKKSNIITAIICAVSLTASYHIGTVAAGSQVTYNSQGKIMFDNNTEDTADDVIFDASDFKTISDMVITGKRQVGTELNKYPSVNFDLTNSIPDFSDLANAIDILTDDATAENNMILKDYTAYVKGSKIKGTIPSKEAADYTPGKGDQTIAAGQYLSGVQTIKGDANLAAANIVSGKTIFGVAGSAQAESHTIETNKSVNIANTSGTITPSSGNDAMSAVTYSVSGVDASKIISGQSILGVAGSAAQEAHTEMSRSFSQSEMASADVTIEAGKGITIPANQYLSSNLTVRAEELSPASFYEGKTLTKVSTKGVNGTWTLEKDALYVALGVSYADGSSKSISVSHQSGTGSILQHIQTSTPWGDNYAFSSYDLIDGKTNDVYKVSSNMTSAHITLYIVE